MTYDVVILGGGLAGSAAGIALARRLPGLRILLLEQKRYPADKLCGEFLSPECLDLFEALGVWDSIRGLGPTRYHSARISSPGGVVWEARLAPGEGLGLSRLALDACLFQAASRFGAEARPGTKVVGLHGNLKAGFEIEVRRDSDVERVQARVVVGAHGKRSSLDRLLKRRFLRQRQPFVALKAHFEGPAQDGWVELNAFPGGYCGINRVEGGLVNVCLLAHEDSFRRGGGAPDPFVGWMRRQNSRLDDFLGRARPLQPWMAIAGIPFGSKPPVERDVLMVGDSAGLISPLAGNGQAMAMQAGQMAAHFVARALDGREGPAYRLPETYATAWKRRFGPRLALGRVLQQFMLRPGGLSLGLHALNALPRLGHCVIEHTRET